MARLKLKPPPFKWKPFSEKQVQVLTWWMPEAPYHDLDALICDGSVRAGKTISMSFSYIAWAMETFIGEQFGMAGKTIGALRRNVIGPLKRMLTSRGYQVHDNQTDNVITVSRGLVANYFFLFGGKDERSQDLIQGITLAGMFFDEAALMPQSFVNQAVARCSVEERKYWFNCNPEGPYHWFKLDWIDKAKEKRVLHIHFTMDDNLSLSDKVKDGYRRLFSGVFYKRYILGLWVLAEGVVYDMFDPDVHVVDKLPEKFDRLFVGGDFGMNNPTAFLLLGQKGKDFYVIREYYHASGKKHGDDAEALQVQQKTVGQYVEAFTNFLGDDKPEVVYLDPSALALIRELRAKGFTNIKAADNTVNEGIQLVQNFLSGYYGQLRIHNSCVNLIREFSSYAWDPKAQERGEDAVIKENDHALDALRYALFNMWHALRKTKARKERQRGGKGGTII